MTRLQKGWDLVAIDEIAKLVQYGTSAKTSDYPDGVPVLRMGNIQDGRIVFSGFKSLPEDHPEFPKLLLVDGDVLFNRTNSPELVGKTAVFRGDLRMSFASYLIRVQLNDRCLPEWLSFYLNSSYGRTWVSESASQQVGQANISGGKLRALEIPLPPVRAQERILTVVGSLLESCRRTKQSVTDIPKLLDLYRQSVLAAAFRGDLTAKWREQHSDKLEPAATLLWRIRVKRRAQRQVRGKNQEAVAVDPNVLYELPEGWSWSRIGAIADVSGGLTKNGTKRTGGTPAPLVSVAAVQLRSIDLSQISTINVVAEDKDKALLESGDLLIVEGNGSIGHIGRVAIWDEDVPGARHQNHLIKVRPCLLAPIYVQEWLASPRGRQFIIEAATSAAGLYTLSISKVENLPIPIPPIQEQIAILDAVKKATNTVEGLSLEVEALHSRLKQLDQSILAKAFRGELVAHARE